MQAKASAQGQGESTYEVVLKLLTEDDKRTEPLDVTLRATRQNQRQVTTQGRNSTHLSPNPRNRNQPNRKT